MSQKNFLQILSEQKPEAVEPFLEEFHKFNEAGAPFNTEPDFEVPEGGFYDLNSFLRALSEAQDFFGTTVDWAFSWDETPQGEEYWCEIDWLVG